MTENKKAGRWQPGKSGNPRGKPPGTGELQKLRTAIGEHVPAIIEQLATAAIAGDVQAARLILERVLPPMKATEQPQAMALPDGSLTEQGRAVLAAVAAGELAPGQGAALLGAIATLGKVAELDELSARVAALENARGTNA